MRKKMYWGLASLILIIGVVGVYFMLQPDPDPEVEKKFIVPSETDLEKARETNQPPREAKDGFKWEWHADHWHEVSIAQNETVTVHPVQENQPEKPEFTGPLTYHKELLESNPVKALRLQAEERGHWATKWIPPFPPDDSEAQTFARHTYLFLYYKEGTPEFEKHVKAYLDQLDHISHNYPFSARKMDLKKITWTIIRNPIDHYDPRNGYALYPSDYFPNHISDLK